MPFVEAKCPNCGGTLSADSTKNIWICGYCQTPFIFEKSVNNYAVMEYDNITAGTVNVSDVTESDFVIRDGKLQVYRGISRDVIIPDSVEEICKTAFSYSTHLKSVIIPNSVKKMDGAFQSCTSLESVIIPDSVTYIGNAFSGCTALKSVKIPENVNFIGENDFSGCNSLTDIDYPHLKEFEDCFPALLDRKKADRKRKGLCVFCGGKFSLFGTCKICGKKKDY